MPGILICHSHHNPRTQAELQDMGMLWARLGCMVLVMDQLGHGERRQHPFPNEKSYAGTFRAGRQDYYFRSNTGAQLYLIGDSLAGWMAWDMSRGVDLLLARPGIDRDRIILLGAVAGGGDPSAVAAALDRRITAVAPFNFGGPQPETVFPLPADAEKTFNYAGGGSWESTRNLRLSARDGFLPWVIVGSVAPRGLIYSHEFAWDRERDPVWARLEKIFDFYKARDHLAFAHGRGTLSGKPPESTHCNNIGAEHRKPIYPVLKRWFGIPEPEKEFQDRRPVEELLCLTTASGLKARPLYELAGELGMERAHAARLRWAGSPPASLAQRLRRDWNRLLGGVLPTGTPRGSTRGADRIGDVTVEKISLQIEPDIVVPLLLLLPPSKGGVKLPLVVGVSQHGKQQFLEQRSEALALLLEGGTAVCLPDLRGTGETRPGDARGRSSSATSISATELMLGQTLVGSRLRDLRSVLLYLRSRGELDGKRVALWGDSFAPVNPEGRNLAVPLDADKLPDQAEPLGGLMALFGALYDEQIRAICVRGGIVGYQSALSGQFLYLPHDAIIPGALTAGDLCDVASALAPRSLRLEGLVDAQNRKVGAGAATKTYEVTANTYRAVAAIDRLQIVDEDRQGVAAAQWLLGQLQRK
jgi:cephalosporin-C deacetylase-like acetyl esterase